MRQQHALWLRPCRA